MGVAYQSYCYASPDEAAIALASEYRHEHNPAYTRVIPSVSGSDVIIQHYKIQGASLILDSSVPAYTLPQCSVIGPLNRSSLDSPPLEDAITASWLTAAVLISAWSIKVMRRAL